jgi:hypothetical protein
MARVRTPATGLTVAVLIGLAVVVVMAAGTVLLPRSQPPNRPVEVDFRETRDAVRILPMPKGYLIVERPEHVRLWFPGGQVYAAENVNEVWVQCDGLNGTSSLIESVFVNFDDLTVDEAYGIARQARDQFGVENASSLEDWHDEHANISPRRTVGDKAGGSVFVPGVFSDGGRQLTVEVSASVFEFQGHVRYAVDINFTWLPPESRP